jgi:hypothetical protein
MSRAKHGLAVVEDAAQAHLAAVDGPPGRHLRAAGRVQLLPDQEHDRGEGGMVVLRRRGRRPHGAPPAQPGHGAALRQRDRRLQHADDRPARRHRSGPARRAARPDGAAARRNAAVPQQRWRHAWAGAAAVAGRRARCGTSTPSGPDRDRLRAGWPTAACGTASTTRRRSTGSPLRARSSTCPYRTSRGRCSPCRSTRVVEQTQLEHVVRVTLGGGA